MGVGSCSSPKTSIPLQEQGERESLTAPFADDKRKPKEEGREKKMEKHGYKFSDNPLAMHESMSLKLIKEYEGIKVKK